MLNKLNLRITAASNSNTNTSMGEIRGYPFDSPQYGAPGGRRDNSGFVQRRYLQPIDPNLVTNNGYRTQPTITHLQAGGFAPSFSTQAEIPAGPMPTAGYGAKPDFFSNQGGFGLPMAPN